MLGFEAFRVGGSTSPGATGRVAGYDAGVMALPGRAVSVGLSAARTQSVAPRVFGTARDQLTHRHGIVVTARAPFLESTVHWTNERIESQARADQSVMREGEVGRTFEYSGAGSSARHPFSFDYRRERRTDLVFPALSFPLETATVQYRLRARRGRAGPECHDHGLGQPAWGESAKGSLRGGHAAELPREPDARDEEFLPGRARRGVLARA